MDKLLKTCLFFPQFAQGRIFSTDELDLSTAYKEDLLNAVLPGIPEKSLHGGIKAWVEL